MYEDLFDLRLDGFVLNEEKRLMYGRMHDIQVMIEPYLQDNKHRISLQLNLETSSHKDEFLEYVNGLEKVYPFVHFAGCQNDMTVFIIVDALGSEDRSNLERVADDITAKCEECQLHSCCEFCKSTGALTYIEIEDNRKLVCEECATKLQDTLTDLEKKQKENIFLGIIGAIVGAMIGSILWIILDQVGFIAGIAGYAIVYCSLKGYELLGKRITKRGVIVCVIICILTVFFADFLSMGIEIYREFFNENGLPLSAAIMSVPFFLSEGAILRPFIINLLIGYLLGFIGSYSLVGAMWNHVKNAGKPRRVTRL